MNTPIITEDQNRVYGNSDARKCIFKESSVNAIVIELLMSTQIGFNTLHTYIVHVHWDVM